MRLVKTRKMKTDALDVNEIRGTGVGRGTAVAPALLWVATTHAVGPTTGLNAEAEVSKFDDAVEFVEGALRSRADEVSEPLNEILRASAMMAKDPALRATVIELIESGLGADAATHDAVAEYVNAFERAGGLLAQRTPDLLSVRNRLIAKIQGRPQPQLEGLEDPVIIVAEDLAPADTAMIDMTKVAGIITELGGSTSHTAIIANQLGIPCLVGAKGAMEIPRGAMVGLSSAAGIAWVDPSATQIESLKTQQEILQSLLKSGTSPKTTDGQRIELLANVGSVSDAHRAADSEAEGIGLVRTEFLFLNRSQPPDRDEQSTLYSRIAREFPGRKIVIRTLDAGSDKPLRFIDMPHEANPALGVRGARVYRQEPALLQTQLEALAQVGAHENIWVMASMISTPAEARYFAKNAREAGIGKVGVMIETPAAALRAREVLAEVDFASLGTNDLVQYTMAADRLNADLDELLSPWQPAVLDLIAHVSRVATELEKPLSVCGEAASDPLFSLVAAGLGIYSLSMAVNAIPAIGFVLNDHSLDECRAMAQAALEATEWSDARAAVQNLLNDNSANMLGL